MPLYCILQRFANPQPAFKSQQVALKIMKYLKIIHLWWGLLFHLLSFEPGGRGGGEKGAGEVTFFKSSYMNPIFWFKQMAVLITGLQALGLLENQTPNTVRCKTKIRGVANSGNEEYLPKSQGTNCRESSH